MLIHVGSVPTLVVSSAEAASEIMKTQDIKFANRPNVKMWKILFRELKEVTVAPYGEYWRQVKSIMTLHLLSNKKVEDNRDIREEEIAAAVRKSTSCLVDQSRWICVSCSRRLRVMWCVE
ncbi:putative indoleacetaldoxime dehydratase [Helianthus annuus]|nr:putative indoleacetaldoxime dehydratase [Helianthus annuus]